MATWWLLSIAAGLGPGCGPSTPEGTTRKFTQEGRAGVIVVEGQEAFLDGEWRKHGEFVFSEENGDERSRGRYEHGLETGPWRQKYEDGSTGVGSYKDGSRSGSWRTFHRNGKLQDQGSYAQGVRDGVWVSYRDDGTKLREATYSDGEMNGRVTWFGPDGSTVDRSRSGEYRNGELK